MLSLIQKTSNFFENLYSKSETDEEKENFVREALEGIDSEEPDFTMEEILEAINWLKNNKATGPDGIPAEILKACPKPVIELLLGIMNRIKHLSIYPQNWGLGITSLLFKEGDDGDPNNYRAITVSDTISKILAIMLHKRIGKWDTEGRVMRNEQIGNKKGARPSDHLLVIKTLIDSYARDGRKLYACFVDFRKAYDSLEDCPFLQTY